VDLRDLDDGHGDPDRAVTTEKHTPGGASAPGCQDADIVDLQAVESLLAAADAGGPLLKLARPLEALVARALETGHRSTLKAALRALLIEAGAHREDRTPAPPRLAKLLVDVRAALRGLGR
jgi:hypothetical protein